MERGNQSPAALFDAAVDPNREHELAEAGLVVVARPGTAPPYNAEPGLFAIRRGLGEGRLAVLVVVERVAPSRAVLEAEGIPCEGFGDGVFIEVDGATGSRRGLKIAGPERVMARDVVMLRERPSPRPRPPRQPAEDTDPSPLATLLAAVYALRRRRARTVREEYLRSLLEPESGSPPLRDQLQRAVAELQQRRAGLPGGNDRAAALSAVVEPLAAGLLSAAERAFILDTQRSTLDLLEPADRDRYVGFAWQDGDFPGGPPGPNEARADQMFAAL